MLLRGHHEAPEDKQFKSNLIFPGEPGPLEKQPEDYQSNWWLCCQCPSQRSHTEGGGRNQSCIQPWKERSFAASYCIFQFSHFTQTSRKKKKDFTCHAACTALSFHRRHETFQHPAKKNSNVNITMIIFEFLLTWASPNIIKLLRRIS